MDKTILNVEKLSNCVLVNAILSQCEIRAADIKNCVLYGCIFDCCAIYGSSSLIDCYERSGETLKRIPNTHTNK